MINIIKAPTKIELKKNRILRKLLSRRIITLEGCWNYTGYLNNKGYGRVAYFGKDWLVSRLSMLFFKPGEFKEYLDVLHTCDNPRCFNPKHLYMGTDFENQQDAVKRGRHYQAAKTHCAHGHEYTKENTYIIPSSGQRQCIICKRKSQGFSNLIRSITV